MTTRRRALIESVAATLLEQHGMRTPPVNVEELARRLGYKLVFKFFDEDDLSGTVVRDASGQITLGINTIHMAVRQRFSIAHEIGHARLHLQPSKDEALFIDPPARVLFRDSRAGLGGDPREIEANQFAAGLLMPEHSIAGALRQVSRAPAKFTIEDLVSRLAKQFEVSAQAMRFRLVTLGIIEPD